MNRIEKLKYGLGRVKNIVEREQYADYQHFFPFPTMFLKAMFLGC